MRTTIWIPDEIVQGMKDEAWRRRISLSKYLVSLHVGKGCQTKVAPVAEEADGFFRPQPKGGTR